MPICVIVVTLNIIEISNPLLLDIRPVTQHETCIWPYGGNHNICGYRGIGPRAEPTNVVLNRLSFKLPSID